MSTELRQRSNQSQQLYVRDLTAAWRGGWQTYDPSIWLQREPELEEKMLRDPDIAHAIGFRRSLIAGKQWSCVSDDNDDPMAELAIEVATKLLKKIRRFTEARMNLARAFFSGARFGAIHGGPEVLTIGDGKPRVWWVPRRIEDQDKRQFRIVARQDWGDPIRAEWEVWDVSAGDWRKPTQTENDTTIRHVYQDEQATLGYGRGLREALGIAWYAKQSVFEESLQANERFGQGGLVKVGIDGLRDAMSSKPNEQLVEDWISAVANMMSRHVIVTDKNDTIEVVAGDAGGWEMQEKMRSELRSMILTLVLGANLTTSADKGGSYALAAVQENSTEALVQFDRESLEETLTDDLLGCIWRKNWVNLLELGIGGLKPRFNVMQDKILDPEKRAATAQVLHGMGVDLAADDLYEQTGFRRPKEGEDRIEGQIAAPPVPMGATGGMDPFGGGAGGAAFS